MGKTARRFVVLTAAVAAIGVMAPSANAADDWILVGTSAATGGVSVPIPTISLIGKNTGPCVPKNMGIEAHVLSEETWWSSTSGEIAFDWHNSGHVWASSDCAVATRMTTTLTDYAPNGGPQVVRGNSQTETQSTPTDGRYAAMSEASLWVVYYDLDAIPPYVRGDSLVETKVHGEYRAKNGTWYEIGCVVVYNTIHPTPDGPIYGPTQTEKCAA
jgi:hypothetical protein